MFRQNTVEESLPLGEKIYAASFICTPGTVIFFFASNGCALWCTDGQICIDTCVAWPHCMYIASA